MNSEVIPSDPGAERTKTDQFVSEALPTQSGDVRAWRPEYLGPKTERCPDGWHAVPTMQCNDSEGIPASGFAALIVTHVGLCSYEQAQALAWQHAAIVATQVGARPVVRVVEYRVVYDIKCYRDAAEGGKKP